MMRVLYGTNKRGINLSSRFVVPVLENTCFQCRRKLRNKHSFGTNCVRASRTRQSVRRSKNEERGGQWFSRRAKEVARR
jgi:hypothetical protein